MASLISGLRDVLRPVAAVSFKTRTTPESVASQLTCSDSGRLRQAPIPVTAPVNAVFEVAL